MKKTENQNSSTGRYAKFLSESGSRIRQGLSEFGKDVEREKLLSICRIFAVAAGVMAIVCAIRTATNFGLI